MGLRFAEHAMQLANFAVESVSSFSLVLTYAGDNRNPEE
mgnify:CR=1 FL=1